MSEPLTTLGPNRVDNGAATAPRQGAVANAPRARGTGCSLRAGGGHRVFRDDDDPNWSGPADIGATASISDDDGAVRENGVVP